MLGKGLGPCDRWIRDRGLVCWACFDVNTGQTGVSSARPGQDLRAALQSACPVGGEAVGEDLRTLLHVVEEKRRTRSQWNVLKVPTMMKVN